MKLTIASLAAMLTIHPLFSYWPTNVNTDFVISSRPEVTERGLTAQPGAQDEVIVVFQNYEEGILYNIIDRYGEFKLPLNTMLKPSPPLPAYYEHLSSYPDGTGGMYVIWSVFQSSNPEESGFHAQRIDSLGNLLWGPEGVHFFDNDYGVFDWCLDGDDGFYFINAPSEGGGNIYIQHINSDGNLRFSISGQSVFQNLGIGADPQVETDSTGGFYCLYELNVPNTGLYIRRYNSSGTPIWNNAIRLTTEPNSWYYDMISDGYNGVIVGYDYSGAWSTHKRVNPGGFVLWTVDDISYWAPPVLTEGETGYFYASYHAGNTLWGQRIRISDGERMWNQGTYGTTLFNMYPQYYPYSLHVSLYKYPYLYSLTSVSSGISDDEGLYVIRTDTLGRGTFGEDGYLLSFHTGIYHKFAVQLVVVTDGVVSVFYHDFGGGMGCEFLAKRCYDDGTLGGPNDRITDLSLSVFGSDVLLNWSSKSPSAEYGVYISTEPYIFPAFPDTVVSDTTYTDVNAVNEGVKYYNVRWEP